MTKIYAVFLVNSVSSVKKNSIYEGQERNKHHDYWSNKSEDSCSSPFFIEMFANHDKTIGIGEVGDWPNEKPDKSDKAQDIKY